MIIEHEGKSPRIDPTCLCGADGHDLWRCDHRLQRQNYVMPEITRRLAASLASHEQDTIVEGAIL